VKSVRRLPDAFRCRPARRALAAGNLEEVAATAHALKSPVNNLGGRRLADLLERCETAARDGADLTVVAPLGGRAPRRTTPRWSRTRAETRRGTGTG